MKAVRVALALGIAILLPLLSQMTVQIFAQPPDYVGYEAYPPKPKTEEARAKANADERRNRATYEKRTADFNLFAFYVSFPLGILEILGGYFLRKRPTLASGIVFGGLSTVAFGSYSSWETLPGWARYASLLFALIVMGILALLMDKRVKIKPSEEAL